MKELKDVIALPPTPLDKNNEIDIVSLKSVIDFEMENGCYGVGVLAAIGEGYLLSNKNWTLVAKIAIDHMNGRGPLHVGCASMGTQRAVNLAKKAENLGADSILAFNPQGGRHYSSEEIYNHFKSITNSIDINVVPYARANDIIPFEVIKKLVDEGRIKYMKYAFRSCALLQKLHENLDNKLFKFCGADSWTLRYLLLGCKGIMTATASVLPKENVELLKLVHKKNIIEARKLWYEKFLTWNDSGFFENWQWAHKYALKLMGIIKTDYVISPQVVGTDYHKEEIKSLLKYQGKI